MLPKAVRLLKSKIDHDFDDDGCDSDGDGKNYLNTLGSVWKTFYHDILSTLECMLFSIEVNIFFCCCSNFILQKKITMINII